AEVMCPHCNQMIAVPADAQPTEAAPIGPGAPGTVLEGEPAPAAAGDPEAPEAQPEEEAPEEQAGIDLVLGWLALYLPSWGTSVVLHVAVITLAAFMAWQTQTVPPPFEYKSAVVQMNKPKTEKRQQQQSPRGKATKRQPTSIVRQFTQNPFPDVASNNQSQLQVIGVGGGGKAIGGFEGMGTGGRGFFGAGPEEEEANKIVYVVDRSGSMTDSIDYVKYELKRSISELTEDKEFHVVFYSSGPPVEMPTRRLVNATERNKQLAFEFIDGVVPQGETDPSKALERAFACNPELIYLLTDGEFDKTIVGLVKRLNVGGKITVHTIGFLYQSGEAVLKQIADENNGQYKFVSEADLATLVQ
ncbi:MAG TPA: VWA domain-containing protein, partial [Phycisphaerae bacterium]|nr:VWA domain-containing protein [Phycisphaerae bacterium]